MPISHTFEEGLDYVIFITCCFSAAKNLVQLQWLQLYFPILLRNHAEYILNYISYI